MKDDDEGDRVDKKVTQSAVEGENMLCFFLLNLIEDMKLKCGQSTQIWSTKTATG